MSLKKAAIINAISKYSNVILNLVFNAILARILTPDDFGIVAVVTVFTTFFTLLSDMGFGTAVIQNKELSHNDIVTIHSFMMYCGFLLSVFFYFFGYGIAFFYQNIIYINICLFLAISLFFNTLSIVPNALLSKNKQFIQIGIRTIIGCILQGFITILLAFNGQRYYSIIIATVCVSIFNYIWNIYYTKLNIKFKLNMKSIRLVWGYSLYQLLFNVINYFSRNLDNLLAGKFMGNSMLGYYDKAYKLSIYPVSNITHVVTPVLHPILSEYQNNKQLIFKKYIEILKLLSIIGIFLSVICYGEAEAIIRIMYGNNWGLSVPCFKFFSLSIWFQVTASSCGSIYQSLGNTKLMFKSATRFVPVQILCIAFGVYSKDITILSAFVSVSFILKFVIEYYYLICKGFGYRYGDLWKIIRIDLFQLIFLFTVMNFVEKIVIPINFVLLFITHTIIVGFIYLFVLIFTKQVKYITKLFK
jgi:Membrane protein involved in the export of O-antigen and teichoic acid